MEGNKVVKKLEKMRKQIIVLYIIGMTLFTTMVIIMVVAAIKEKSIPQSFILTVIVGLIMSFFTGLQKGVKKKFRKLYKETFVYDLLDSMLEDVSYYPWKGLDSENVRDSGIIQMGNVYGSDDVLIATYKGIKFCQADVGSRFVDENNREAPKDYFSGRLIIFDYSYKNVEDVKVLDKTFNSDIEGLGKKILLENIEFNKKYDVYSWDDEEAFYVLTPHFMEKVMELREQYNNIGFRFTYDKLYVAVSNDYAFDTPGNKKINYGIERERVKKHIQIIIDIIDAIKPDREV